MATFTKLTTGCAISYGGSSYDYQSDAYIGKGASNLYNCGLFFPAVTIPAGASIISAKVSFTPWQDFDPGVTTRVKITYQDLVNPPIFFSTETYAQFEARARSVDVVHWDFTTAWASETPIDCVDFSSVFQALVIESYWVSGNNCVLFFDNDASDTGSWRGAYQHSSSANGPVLTVEYSLARLLRAIEKY